MKTVADLIAHVVSECSTIDQCERYREMLDSEGTIEVGGLSFYPSRIVEELDPIAFSCGVSDFADGAGWVEIDGEYYESDAVEAAREEFLDEMRSELEELEGEQTDADQDGDTEEMVRLERDIQALESRIAELEAHTF